MSEQARNRMPAIFFGHGSPMNTLADNRYTQTWRRVVEALPRPESILCISAHWFTRGTAVTAMARPKTIHDFGGFPQALFDVQYPAPGDPALAKRVQRLLAPAGVALDHDWGLDHGAWSVLAHAYPDASVPVVQMSIDATQPARYHYALGQQLAPLRDEGVLILGSGNVVHNLGVLNRAEGTPAFDWAQRFNDRVRGFLGTGDHASLVGYTALGEDAQLSVPTPEHYLPLLYIAALQNPEEPLAFAVDGIELGSISMLSVVIGEPEA